jgi:hypothetical protein
MIILIAIACIAFGLFIGYNVGSCNQCDYPDYDDFEEDNLVGTELS